MSEPPLDLGYVFPDKGHQDLWERVKQALTEAQQNTAGVDDAYWLTDLLFSLLDSAFAAVDQLSADLAALATRVAALEPAPAPEEPPVAN